MKVVNPLIIVILANSLLSAETGARLAASLGRLLH